VVEVSLEHRLIGGESIAVGHRNMEDLRVGDRVIAQNPEVSQDQRNSFVEPDWSTWLKLTLEMPKQDGQILHIEMIRPEKWFLERCNFVVEPKELPKLELEEVVKDNSSLAPTLAKLQHAELPIRSTALEGPQKNKKLVAEFSEMPELKPASVLNQIREVIPQVDLLESQVEKDQVAFGISDSWKERLARSKQFAKDLGLSFVGMAIELDLPEMGAMGIAAVKNIEPCSEIENSSGNVVTSTFRHPPSTIVLDVAFEGETDLIGVTTNHPFWSVEEQAFVPIGEMEVGDLVQTFNGDTKRIESKLPRPGPESVYNIEVWGEHVYFVGERGWLAHNMCPSEILRRGAANFDELNVAIDAIADQIKNLRGVQAVLTFRGIARDFINASPMVRTALNGGVNPLTPTQAGDIAQSLGLSPSLVQKLRNVPRGIHAEVGALLRAAQSGEIIGRDLDAILVVTGGIEVCGGCRNLIPDLARELGVTKLTIIDTAKEATVTLFGPELLDSSGRTLRQALP